MSDDMPEPVPQSRAARGGRAFLEDDRGTSTVEFIMVSAMVAVPLMLLYSVFLRGLVAEWGFVCFLLSQAAP